MDVLLALVPRPPVEGYPSVPTYPWSGRADAALLLTALATLVVILARGLVASRRTSHGAVSAGRGSDGPAPDGLLVTWSLLDPPAAGQPAEDGPDEDVITHGSPPGGIRRRRRGP